MMQGLQFVMLHVPDVARARAFYTEQLGFAIEDETPDFVQFKRPEAGGATVALGKGDADPATSTELWWFVADADAAHRELVGRGVTTATAPEDAPFGRTFTVRDPGGNVLSMLQLPTAHRAAHHHGSWAGGGV